MQSDSRVKAIMMKLLYYVRGWNFTFLEVTVTVISCFISTIFSIKLNEGFLEVAYYGVSVNFEQN